MKTRTGFWKFIVVLLVTGMLLASCAPAAAPAAPAEPAKPAAPAEPAKPAATAEPAKAEETILIGGGLATTGIQAPLDEPAAKGAELAVELKNKAGGVLGKKVAFINLDGKSDPVTEGNVAVQLISQGAKALISSSDFDFGGPASREAQKAGLVGLSPCASSPLYGSKALGDKQFTMSMWNTTMGAAAAEYAYKTKGWKSTYVVTDDFIDYTKSLSRYYIAAFKDLGGEVIFEDKYTQGAQDFSAQLARLKNSAKKPDVIYLSSYMPDLGTIIRAIREAGITTPILGGDSYDDPGLFKAVGEQYGNDITFVTHTWMMPDASPEMKAFLDAYKAKFGKEPDAMWAVPGFDAANVLMTAMEKAGSTDGAAMAKAMETTEFSLLTGKLTWSAADKGHEPNKSAAMVMLTKAVPAFIGWVRPEKLPPA